MIRYRLAELIGGNACRFSLWSCQSNWIVQITFRLNWFFSYRSNLRPNSSLTGKIIYLLTNWTQVACIPWKSSGAAYGGLPQNVSSLPPTVNSLLNPKSASLMFLLRSINRFSAYKLDITTKHNGASKNVVKVKMLPYCGSKQSCS